MDLFDDQEERPASGPRTVTVVTLLAIAAFVFSYLGAYALTDAMVSADLMSAWPADDDPRSRNMLVGFAGLMCLFLIVAWMFRLASRRQLRRIDAIVDARED